MNKMGFFLWFEASSLHLLLQLTWEKEFSTLYVFHFLLDYQCDDAENGGSGYGYGSGCVGLGGR